MARYMVLALTGAKGGEDAEERFNTWYDETHLPELLAVDGVISARRFRVLQGSLPQPYAAAYEIETDDLPAVMKEMQGAMSEFPPEFDRDLSANLVAVEITKE